MSDRYFPATALGGRLYLDEEAYCDEPIVDMLVLRVGHRKVRTGAELFVGRQGIGPGPSDHPGVGTRGTEDIGPEAVEGGSGRLDTKRRRWDAEVSAPENHENPKYYQDDYENDIARIFPPWNRLTLKPYPDEGGQEYCP